MAVDPFEAKNIQSIIARNKQINRILNDAYKDISRRFTTVKGKRFAKVLQTRIRELQKQLESNIKVGIKQHWKLGNANSVSELAGSFNVEGDEE